MTRSALIADMVTSAGAHLLIVAPHPDDESLATGGLIQVALKHGARVTVVILTDGENNAWPQRAAERRVLIGPTGRKRWGARRREEARRALATLGVPDTSVRYLGLPDLGLTDQLAGNMRGAVAELCAIVDIARPTAVVIPSLHDRHPDHSAAHVMTHMALASGDWSAIVLSYILHGQRGTVDAECALEKDMWERKMDAVSAHTSQLLLSRRRMLRYAKPTEQFALEQSRVACSGEEIRRLPWSISPVSAAVVELMLVTSERAWRLGVQSSASRHPSDSPACVRRADGSLLLELPRSTRAGAPLFAKLVSRVSSPWIYDRWGWTRLDTQPVA